MKDIRVMIVEDDARIANLHERFTSKVEGFKVVCIAQQLNLVESMIEIHKPDLILLDLYFPEGTSLDLLRNIRIKGIETDVILITAAREIGPLKEALRGGVFDYIIKPVIQDRFIKCLKKFREYFYKLSTTDIIGQNDVDNMLHNSSISSNNHKIETLPKGIDPLTLKKVRAVFKSEDLQIQSGLSAEDVGSIIGASRSTTRRYLEYMVSVNLIYPDLVYGSVGRPERKYFAY